MNFYSKYKIKRLPGSIETHEVFLDKLAQIEEENLGITEKKLEVPLAEKVPYILLVIFLLVALTFFSKVFFFQIIGGKKLYTAAENNKGSALLIIPERGVIYDINFEKLVSNSPAFDFVCDRRRFLMSSEEISNEIDDIAEVLAMSSEYIKQKIIDSGSTEILVSENISHENLLVLETKMNDFSGCKIQQNTERNYFSGAVFSQVLGYTGRINKDEYSSSSGYAINDYIGKTGLERYYETYLRGTPGQKKEVKTASGIEQGTEILSEPEPGYNLVLNIDAGLQERIYNALGKSLENVGAKKGAAVAMDPKTGAVLALVSYPSYDNNLFSGGISQEDYDNLQNDVNQPLFNRAIQGQYPTGSTIKPFEAAAALQEKLISPTKQINDPGYILVPNQYDPSIVYRYGGVAPHGWVDMKKALAVSSNIYFYTIGGGYEDQKGLGPTKIKEYLSLFGWNEKTGIDLPSEFSGLIPDPDWKKRVKGEGWWDGDTYNLSIGQSDLQTTPLQVASAYCAIANGGTLYKPQIVNKIISGSPGSSQLVKQFSPEVIRSNFIDPENLEIVREGMRDGVVQPYGLSTYLNDLPFSVAAKTGTAEIGYKDRFNVWSAVFAPYEDPQIVLVMTVERVNGLGAVTLPVAKEVLNWYFAEK
ncbi:MAG: penicillin-binding protein 2 [Candidatus Staskawiczbacteria bacterium RIFOXYC1_FULL_37_43]|nr:MAG: penicillin-binding protein 2 [Candidatus Staskawiczbacteria bacterium RIFOXYA1_FULL_37_15]OGZ77291.1 MAG: penicillin-binding protein 2 [Candidatus Staskawiczbacteria bacterium RIFOXYA12_FULL_37_10]OGZ79997.1 MAG: penicillin-binding protein 2 [Candidatus Staskawiczbacteria bacterium RIFOXYB1_FULL_38_37]OGZ81567.1 MAG: penicillin-binding protein 2 [Candidatus Staskawiczbacteria bacterium RIFOXYB2_FULL_37_10]OGZ81637.1 MAG: penicillin-binding protein 2 [Candidatus Staskawiczbacteria bacter